jgi:DNA-binding transcriptional ArsR family regulator
VKGEADVAAAAALLAEPARAALVVALTEHEALPASALAAHAGIAPSTASEHLRRLVEGGFIVARKNGRHRYFSLADPAVADAVEALACVAPQPPVRSLREATKSELIREARTCYDHLAGRLGVSLASALEQEGTVIRRNGDYVLGPEADARCAALEIELAGLEKLRRPVVRGCLDWSERELHIAGTLGAALASRFFDLGWIRRREANRSVELTDEGRTRLSDLGVELTPMR